MIDLNNCLFHGLTNYLTANREQESINRLNKILKCKAILSRRLQDINLEKLNLPPNDYDKLCWNGIDYISVCRKQDSKNGNSEAFCEFVETGIGIILDNEILANLEVREENKIQEGEIQIKDFIPSSYFKGIAINFMSDKQFKEHTEYFVKEGMTLEECSKILDEQYKDIEPIRDCLDNNGFENLQIYSIKDGNIITNSQNVISSINTQTQDLTL